MNFTEGEIHWVKNLMFLTKKKGLTPKRNYFRKEKRLNPKKENIILCITMKHIIQKRLAAQILKCSPGRIRLEQDRLEDITKAITKADIKSMIKDKAIKRLPIKGIAKFRSRKRKEQKKRGRQRGHGSRKGTKNARSGKKRRWMNSVRAQRGLLKGLRDKGLINKKSYRELYLKVKSGFFRNRRHIKLYIGEQNLLVKSKKIKNFL